MCARMWVWVCVCVCVYVCVCVRARARNLVALENKPHGIAPPASMKIPLATCVYARGSVCICVLGGVARTLARTRARMHARTHAHTHARTHTHTHTHTRTHTLGRVPHKPTLWSPPSTRTREYHRHWLHTCVCARVGLGVGVGVGVGVGARVCACEHV